MVNVCEDGRLHIKPLTFQRFPPQHHARTLLARQFDVLEYALLLFTRHQRVDRCIAVHARAHRQGRDCSGQPFDKAIVNRAVHIEARCRSTHLAIVQQTAKNRALDGFFDVSIGQDDHRVLAAQFQGKPGHILHTGHANTFAHKGGAGERHLAHQWVAGQPTAD